MGSRNLRLAKYHSKQSSEAPSDSQEKSTRLREGREPASPIAQPEEESAGGKISRDYFYLASFRLPIRSYWFESCFFFSSFFLFFLFSSSFYRGCSAISFNSIFFSGRLASGRGRRAGWGQPRVGMSRRAGEAVAGESEGAGGGALLWRGQEKREKERRRKKREGRDRNGEGVVLERVPAGNNWEERAVARAAEDWSGRGGARAPGVKASSTGNPPSCQDSSSSRKESAILGRTSCRLCARLRVFR